MSWGMFMLSWTPLMIPRNRIHFYKRHKKEEIYAIHHTNTIMQFKLSSRLKYQFQAIF